MEESSQQAVNSVQEKCLNVEDAPKGNEVPHQVDKRDVFVGKWLKMQHVDYEVRGKVVKNFEMIARTTRRADTGFDAVVAYPILDHTDKPKQLIVIANYRAPVDKRVLEVPAGLMDCPSLMKNAVRELKEETGYVTSEADEIQLSNTEELPATFSNSAVSAGSAKTVFLRVDPNTEENQNPKQELEEAEDITVHLVDIDSNILDSLLKLSKEFNYGISGGLWSFAQGIAFSYRFPMPTQATLQK